MRWIFVPLLLLGCGKGSVTINEAESDTDTDTDSDTDTDADADTDTDTDTDTDVDLPPTTPVIGRTYALDLASGTFVQPPGVGTLLQAQIGDLQILLGVLSATQTEAQFIGALGDGSEPPLQDTCEASIDFPPVDFTSEPDFVVGPDDTTITVSGVDVTIDDLFVNGSFLVDGSAIEDASLEGSIDTRPLVPLLDPNGGPNAICNLVSFFNINCMPCPAGGNFCLSLVIEDLEAAEVPSLTLVERLQIDVDADPLCD